MLEIALHPKNASSDIICAFGRSIDVKQLQFSNACIPIYLALLASIMERSFALENMKSVNDKALFASTDVIYCESANVLNPG